MGSICLATSSMSARLAQGPSEDRHQPNACTGDSGCRRPSGANSRQFRDADGWLARAPAGLHHPTCRKQSAPRRRPLTIRPVSGITRARRVWRIRFLSCVRHAHPPSKGEPLHRIGSARSAIRICKIKRSRNALCNQHIGPERDQKTNPLEARCSGGPGNALRQSFPTLRGHSRGNPLLNYEVRAG